jgi:hypothetical protein
VAALRRSLQIPDSILQIEAIANRGVGVLETFKAILAECLQLVGDPAKAPAGRNPSIVPGQRVSMFPGAEPAALGQLRAEGRRLPRLETDG